MSFFFILISLHNCMCDMNFLKSFACPVTKYLWTVAQYIHSIEGKRIKIRLLIQILSCDTFFQALMLKKLKLGVVAHV